MVLLNARVSMQRIHHEHYIGDDARKGSEEPDPLLVASRSHQNFVENIPMAFILAAIVELNGGNRKVLSALLAALLALRIGHSELGLRGKGSIAWGRPIGWAGTNASILGLAGYAAYLVKGYWGY